MAITTNFSNGVKTKARDRKYTAFWGVFLMASVALFFDKLSGAEFANLVWPVFGLFMGGNVGQHWTERKNS